jgi:hypothetical protein
MLDKRNIPIGIVAAWTGYYAATHIEKTYWFPAALVAFLGTVASLHWLARVEIRRLHRLLSRAALLMIAGLPYIARAAGGGGTTVLAGLQQGLGLIMLIAVPTGVIMIIKAVLQHQSGDSTWKMEILKGLIMMGAPVIINALFNLFFNNAGVQVTIPNF